jgi:signal peptidase II
MAVVRGDSAVRRRGIRWAMLAIAATVVAADQVSKTLVLRSDLAAGTGWAAVRLVRNTGASGGIAAGYPVLVTLAAVLIAGAAGTLALRARGRGMAICLAAVLGGALGNLSDRLFRSPGFGRGAVVDWIHFGGSGSFNVADMAIQFGVLAAVVVMFASEHAGKVTRAETKA